jgi:hypothetical protein
MADIRIDDAIARIPAKFERLRLADPEFRVYGASRHKYQLKPRSTESEILAFEKYYGITLPIEYRTFLRELGSGGAGPGNGLIDLEILPQQDDDGFDSKFFEDSSRIQKQFPISTKLAQEALARPKDKRFIEDVEYDGLGCLEMADHGCGSFSFLVITGEQRGTVWYHGCSMELIPAVDKQGQQLDFLGWYEDWLDHPAGWVPEAYRVKPG